MAKIITLKFTSGKNTWIARITGRSEKFGWNREFLACAWAADTEVRDSKKYVYDEDGVYEVCEAGKRRFVHVTNDTVVTIDLERVVDLVVGQQRRLDDVIEGRLSALFNSEGGFTATPGEN